MPLPVASVSSPLRQRRHDEELEQLKAELQAVQVCVSNAAALFHFFVVCFLSHCAPQSQLSDSKKCEQSSASQLRKLSQENTMLRAAMDLQSQSSRIPSPPAAHTEPSDDERAALRARVVELEAQVGHASIVCTATAAETHCSIVTNGRWMRSRSTWRRRHSWLRKCSRSFRLFKVC